MEKQEKTSGSKEQFENEMLLLTKNCKAEIEKSQNKVVDNFNLDFGGIEWTLDMIHDEFFDLDCKDSEDLDMIHNYLSELRTMLLILTISRENNYLINEIENF